MKQFTIAALAILVATSSFSEETNVVGKTYEFTIANDVIFESHEKMEFYTFKWGDAPHIALFMLSVNPAPLTPRALKPMADMMEVTFEDQITTHMDVSDIQKKRNEVDLGSFKGTQLEFVVTQPTGIAIRQYMLILHDGSHAWNGQLTANSTNDIARTHMIIKKAKKIANKTNGE